jgi:DNA-binding protein H-NS
MLQRQVPYDGNPRLLSGAVMSEAKQSGRSEFDLDHLTVQELTALRDKAEGKRLEKLEAAKKAVLSEAREKLAALGLSFEGIFPAPAQVRKKHQNVGEKLPVKYRGPKGEEWSGRGRLPKWIMELEKQGHNRIDFMIQNKVKSI